MDEPITVGELKELLLQRNSPTHDMGCGIILLLPDNYILSIQWGPGNYCSNRYLDETPDTWPTSQNAELCIWRLHNPKPIRFEGWEGDVNGWVPVPEILRLVDYFDGKPVMQQHVS